MELAALSRAKPNVHEYYDNDETAAQVALLVHAQTLLILTSADGIYADPNDPATLIEEIGGKDAYELEQNIEEAKTHCDGASRKGANGARAKLEYVKEAALQGTTVYIANGKYSIADILAGKVRRTAIRLR